jgi:hypothetical protein
VLLFYLRTNDVHSLALHSLPRTTPHRHVAGWKIDLLQAGLTGAQRNELHQKYVRAKIARRMTMLFWALLASGQINMRIVDGWQAAEWRKAHEVSDRIATSGVPSAETGQF